MTAPHTPHAPRAAHVDAGPGLELVRGPASSPADAPPVRHGAQLVETSDQIGDALHAVDRLPSEYWRFPWRAVDALTGPIPPGDVWFLAGFSGMGKTTFLGSLVDRCYEQGAVIDYMGLETMDHVLRTEWACRRLGIHPADAIKGVLRARQIAGDPEAAALRLALRAELESQTTGDKLARVRFVPCRAINLRALEATVERAVARGSRLLIIDHIDHIDDGDGSNAFAESKRVVRGCLDLAQEYGLTLLVATQCNNEALRGDPLGAYKPPQPNHVYMGAHKRMVASGMLGISRLLLPPPAPSGDAEEDKTAKAAWRAEMDAARHGGDVDRVLVPNTMQVVLMKDRGYGRERATCLLEVKQGVVRDLDERDQYVTDPGLAGRRP